MLDKFLSDLRVPGCIIQVGTTHEIKGYAEDVAPEIEMILGDNGDENLYFLGGVNPEKKNQRASDKDIIKKNYFYIDLDIRKNNPDATDEYIIDEIGKYLLPIYLGQCGLDNWRYIVFTGNGLHVYFFSKEPVEIDDKSAWSMGITMLLGKLEDAMEEEIDGACVNPSRIARLPGSFNNKNEEPKKVQIIDSQDMYTNIIENLEHNGKKEISRIADENKKKIEEMRYSFPDDEDNYKRIDSIPIADVVTMATGWEQRPRGDKVKFWSPDWEREGAMYVRPDKNCYYPGGSRHLPNSQKGYGCFEFIKEREALDSKGAFSWFEHNFPHAFPNLKGGVQPKRKSSRMNQLFKNLETLTFDPLKLNDQLDDYKLIIRGCVTRIGAISYTGKSKMGYYLASLLMNRDYRGIIVSTEVPSEIVLANMLLISMDEATSIWDLINHQVEIPFSIQEKYDKLEIYDVKDTENQIGNVVDIIEKSISENKDDPPSFILVDFCQAMSSTLQMGDVFGHARQYAYDCQTIAQKYNIAFIDLSQLNKAGIKDDLEKYGVIPFENSQALYHAADIAIMLKRDRDPESFDNTTKFHIRKHKYLEAKTLEMDYNHQRGTFSLHEKPIDEWERS